MNKCKHSYDERHEDLRLCGMNDLCTICLRSALAEKKKQLVDANRGVQRNSEVNRLVVKEYVKYKKILYAHADICSQFRKDFMERLAPHDNKSCNCGTYCIGEKSLALGTYCKQALEGGRDEHLNTGENFEVEGRHR